MGDTKFYSKSPLEEFIPRNLLICVVQWWINGLVQDCSNSSALAMELLQSCTKPLMCP